MLGSLARYDDLWLSVLDIWPYKNLGQAIPIANVWPTKNLRKYSNKPKMPYSCNLADMDYYGLSWTVIDYPRLS